MKIALIGTGYSSIELVRILLQHPNAELKKVITHSQGGKELQEMYPHLASIADFSLEDLEMDSFRSGLDVVFLGTPAGVSGKWTPKLLDLGVRVIDLSGDYRLKDPKEYEAWRKEKEPWLYDTRDGSSPTGSALYLHRYSQIFLANRRGTTHR